MPSDPTTPDASLLIDARELARLLSLSVASVHRLRSAGKVGPRPLRAGGRVLWRRSSVEAWIAESERVGRLLDLREWDTLRDAGRAGR